MIQFVLLLTAIITLNITIATWILKPKGRQLTMATIGITITQLKNALDNGETIQLKTKDGNLTVTGTTTFLRYPDLVAIKFKEEEFARPYKANATLHKVV